jgi:hypothetical protein
MPTTYKVKIFSGDDLSALENQINRWLASASTNIAIQRSETAFTQLPGVTTLPVMVVTVWYTEGV